MVTHSDQHAIPRRISCFVLVSVVVFHACLLGFLWTREGESYSAMIRLQGMQQDTNHGHEGTRIREAEAPNRPQGTVHDCRNASSADAIVLDDDLSKEAVAAQKAYAGLAFQNRTY